MFNSDFFPSPIDVIETMLEGINLTDKIVLEPSAGKGDIVNYLINNGAKDVMACEKQPELRAIVAGKCKVIADDFLELTSDKISHINLIVMNPPFSADEHHILHAYNIAPAGCKIIALSNLATVEEKHNRYRRQLGTIVDTYGSYTKLGNCFSSAERKTEVEVALITITKAGATYNSEFEGFFMDEETEAKENGLMPYNFIRDLVNRYVAAIKIYDEQLEAAVRMNTLTSGFYSSNIALSCTEDGKPKLRNDYKKDLQKAAWKFIFEKMDMDKYSTKGLKEELNKFVENQLHIPFTMKNIYKMLEIVVGTHSGRMDQALLEVFDKLTEHCHDNRYNVEGWKTNSHFLIGQKFIIDWMVGYGWSGQMEIKSNSNAELIEDMMKALCHLSGKNYNDFHSLENTVGYRYKLIKDGKHIIRDTNGYKAIYRTIEDANGAVKAFANKGIIVGIEDSQPNWGTWFDWGFFEVKGFKKGTMHFKFKDQDLWGKFNQHIARIKGYPLYEPKTQTAYQDKQTGRKTKQAA